MYVCLYVSMYVCMYACVCMCVYRLDATTFLRRATRFQRRIAVSTSALKCRYTVIFIQKSQYIVTIHAVRTHW